MVTERRSPPPITSRRFEILGKLGEGGMGAVYEAFDRETERVVALKTLRHMSAAALSRFKNEFRALADIHHPNLVQLYELYCEDGEWFFAMELLRDAVPFVAYVRPDAAADHASTTLARTVRRLAGAPDARADTAASEGPPALGDASMERLRDALAQLAEGLSALHAAGKVHRDLKPSNVLVTPAGRVVVVDFGLVADAQAANGSEAIMGTPLYMAPEQIAEAPVGPRADWYAVGGMLYECLTGALPFRGSLPALLFAKVSSDPRPVATLASDAPADLADLADALLRRDPDGRLGGAEVMARLGVQASDVRVDAAVFVGRRAELDALRRALDASRRGSAVVLVHGESGIGKSALVRAFLGQLGAQATVLFGRCYEREHVPYKAFDAAMDALAQRLVERGERELAEVVPEDAPVLAKMFPTLRSVPGFARGRVEADDARDPRDRAAAALSALLSSLARERPVVIVVDDLQWADADSFRLLAAVLRAAEPPPVLWIATMRGTPADFAPVASLLDIARALPLAPLPPTDALELARHLAHDHDEAYAARAVADSGGHPLFLEELARHAIRAGAVRDRPSLDEALWERVGRLSPQTQRVLEILAVAGVPVAQWIAARAACLDEATRSPEIASLRAAHLARTSGPSSDDAIEPYHGRVTEAILARLDPEVRRAHHAALAEAVERSGAASADVEGFLLHHLEACGEHQRAASHARRAAERAASAFAFERAASLYRTALRLGRFPPDENAALRSSLGDALGRSGRGQQAAEAYLAVAARTTGRTRLDAQYRAVQHLLGCGQVARGIAVARTIAKDLGIRFPESELEAAASLIWHRAKIAAVGDRWVVRDASEVDPETLLRIDFYHAIGFGLSQTGLVRGEDLQARGLHLALRTGERKRLASALLLECNYHATATERGRARARTLIAQGSRIAGETGDEHLKALVAAARQFHAFLAGRFAEARELSGPAEDLLRRGAFDPWKLNVARQVDILVSLHFVGALRDAGPRIDAWLSDAARRDDRLFETSAHRLAALLGLASDQPDAVLDRLDHPSWTITGVARATLREHGTWGQIYELWARAQLALYTDDPAALARSLEGFAAAGRSLLMRAVQVMRARGQWLEGLVALALARHRPSRRLVAVAETIARKQAREGTQHGAAIAGMLRAGLASARGDRAGASAALRAALPLVTGVDLALAAAAARWRLGEWMAGPAGASFRAEGARAMHAEGVVDLERTSRVLVPV